MSPLENLHYAIGELAYAIARADGMVQQEERKKFQEIVISELAAKDHDFDVSSIIFQLMDNRKFRHDSKTAYNWAMNELRTNSHYLSPSLKEKCISVVNKIAAAYPPVTDDERKMIEDFKRDIAPLKGDPVYYGRKKS